MLRSRANARQRPSEPTDERAGSSGYPYGGYPNSGSSPAAISGGSEEYGQSSYGGGGYGYNNSTSGGYNTNTSNPFKEDKSKSSSLCSGVIWYLFLTVIFMALSFDAFTQYRGYQRVANHLSSVRSHFDENQPIEDDDDNPQNNNIESLPQAEARELQSKLHSLAETQSHLQASLHEFTSHTIPKLQSEMKGIEHQIDVARRENASRQNQLDALRLQHQQRTEEIAGIKRQFEEKHQKDGQMVIPSGEDKIAVGLESLEDLEDYVEERETTLWTKIEGLIERLKLQSRAEVVQWWVLLLWNDSIKETRGCMNR